MATLKLKKPAAGKTADPQRSRVRGGGSTLKKRPTIAQAQAERARRDEEHAPRSQRPPRRDADEAPPRRPRDAAPASAPRGRPPRPDVAPAPGSNRAFGARTAPTFDPERFERERRARQDERGPAPDRRDRPPSRGPARGAPPQESGDESRPRNRPPRRDEDPREVSRADTRRSDPRRADNRAPGSRPPAGRTPDARSSDTRHRDDRSPADPRRARPPAEPARGRPRQEPPAPRGPARSRAAPAEPRGRGSRPSGPARDDDDEDDDDLPLHESAPGTMRLSKRMSELGIASRREADEWIAKGWVRVDGRVVAELGSRVLPEQHITVDAKARFQQAQRVTVLINKPVGYVSGQAEDGYEPAHVLVRPENQWREDRSGTRFLLSHLRQLAPAGRLDIDSVGLLVLTQDGRIAKQLIGEDSEVEKEYLVRVELVEGERLSDEGLALLNHGLELDGEALRPAQVEWINDDQLRFVLREGKKRQIRRMCEAVGLKVVGLKRVRIGRVMLGDLPPGQWRYLRIDESFV